MMSATDAKVIKIIKPHANNDEVFKEIRDAENAGDFGIGMDIDHAFNSGTGEYDMFCEKLKAITGELKGTMARTAFAKFTDINDSVLWNL